MITLKTLATAKPQEVFDQVANHMMTQKARSKARSSVEEGNVFFCAYRSNGLKCAAGCLIADDEYRPYFEKSSWIKLVEQGVVSDNCSKLIRELQTIHDNIVNVDEWYGMLKCTAEVHHLNTHELDKFNNV